MRPDSIICDADTFSTPPPVCNTNPPFEHVTSVNVAFEVPVVFCVRFEPEPDTTQLNTFMVAAPAVFTTWPCCSTVLRVMFIAPAVTLMTPDSTVDCCTATSAAAPEPVIVPDEPTVDAVTDMVAGCVWEMLPPRSTVVDAMVHVPAVVPRVIVPADTVTS